MGLILPSLKVCSDEVSSGLSHLFHQEFFFNSTLTLTCFISQLHHYKWHKGQDNKDELNFTFFSPKKYPKSLSSRAKDGLFLYFSLKVIFHFIMSYKKAKPTKSSLNFHLTLHPFLSIRLMMHHIFTQLTFTVVTTVEEFFSSSFYFSLQLNLTVYKAEIKFQPGLTVIFFHFILPKDT